MLPSVTWPSSDLGSPERALSVVGLPVPFLGHLPIHFMSRSTETSRTGTILPSFTMTSRARLVGRWSSLVYVNGGVIPHVSNSRRLSSDFLSDSPVIVVPERLIASTVMITHSQPRMYGDACVSLGWCFWWNSMSVFMPGTFSPQ